MRHATASFEVSRLRIEEGDNINVMWAAADLDPAVFPEPTKVDFERPQSRHIAFARAIRCVDPLPLVFTPA